MDVKKQSLEWLKSIVYAVVAATIIRLYVFETMLVPTPSMVPTIQVGDRLFVEKITYTTREPRIGEIVVFWSPFKDERAQAMLRLFDKFMDLFSPRRFKGHVKYVKRLVGRGGDVLKISKGKDGKYHLYVNGKIPKPLEGIEYIPDGIFRYPEFLDWLNEASEIRSDPVKYRNFLLRLSSKYGPRAANLVFSIIGGYEPFSKRYYPGTPYYEYYRAYLSKLNLKELIKRDENGDITVKIPKGFYFFMGDNSPESLDSRFFGFVPEDNVIGMPILRIWPFDRFGPVQPFGG